MTRELALESKKRGNAAFSAGDFKTSIAEFTEAIKHDPTDHVFYSNRSASYASLEKYEEALADAELCIQTKPDWAKGYSRKGLPLLKLKKLDEALAAYEAGLEIDPSNAALKDGLADVKRAKEPPNPMGQLFGDAMWPKLQADPTTREYLNDPAFVNKLKMLQTNPNLFGSFANDPKMSSAIGVILGLGSAGFQTGGGGGDRDMFADKGRGEPEADDSDEEVEEEIDATPEPVEEISEEEKEEREAAKKAEEERNVQEKKQREAGKLADAEKMKGNALYKQRKFDEALEFYEKACTIDPTSAVYINNKAAVYFEKKEYEKCIELCKEAAAKEVAKPKYDYKLIGKSYNRMGNAYERHGDLVSAEEAFQKSLLEDYTEIAKKSLKRVKNNRKKKEETEYLSEVLSEEAKAKGNTFFQGGQWKEAIEQYTEALKRNPKNYKVYSNRAACFSKLMDWGRGLEDCEKCLAIDPTFVKAYIRKGKIEHFLKKYHVALKTFESGLALDPKCTDLLEAKNLTIQKINQENASGKVDPDRAKEAMKDPEIQAILRDPMINEVLRKMQEDPASAQSALADPTVRGRIEKLIQAGILQVGGPEQGK